MIEAARKNNRLLMVAHVIRFWPEYTALVNLARQGQWGKDGLGRTVLLKKPVRSSSFDVSIFTRWCSLD